MMHRVIRAAAATLLSLALVPGASAAPQGEPGPGAGEATIRFNFKGATFDQVIDFFSRATGLPVVRETDVPEGTLDYLAPEAYTLPDALRVLNIILQAKGVMLRVDGEMLYLQKLTEMQREAIPIFVGQLPGSVDGHEIVTVVMPLEVAMAQPMAEKLAAMVAEYGSVTAMDQQNSLVITETAAVVRRLLMIVEQLDRADPEDAVEIFPVRHAKASELMEPLKALLSMRVEKYITDKQGKQTKVSEETMRGLNISFDDRTNTIIAKGVQVRIDKLRETVALLDVPSAGAGRAVRTFALVRLAPTDAVGKLSALFSELPEEQRPTILPLDEIGKVTVVGSQGCLNEAAELLVEIDGGTWPGAPLEREIAMVALGHAEPEEVAAAVRSLLNGRQAVATKMIPGPDRKSLIVAGLASDVEAIRALVPMIDRPAAVDRQVRVVSLGAPDPAAALSRARSIYDRQVEPGDPEWAVELDLDAEARVLTMFGAPEALDRFAEAMRLAESATVIETETRQIELAHATPSVLAPTLELLAAKLLAPTDGTRYVPPTIAAIDKLDSLVVTATPRQFPVLASLVERLDQPGPAMPPLRILQLRTADAANLANALSREFERRHHAERDEKPVSITADAQTNSLIVAAHPDVLPEIQAVVDDLNRADRLDAEGREIRIFPLRVARAQELARTIDEMFPPPPMPRDYRGRPMPHLQQPREIVVRADAQTNALIVDAPIQRMAGFEKLVEQLDRQQIAEETEIRTYRIVNAELQAVAATLRELAAGGNLAPTQHGRAVTTITTEPVSRTVVVSGAAEIFGRVEQVIAELDAPYAGPQTTLRFFRLANARAETLVPMVREILLRRVTEDVEQAGRDVESLLNISADRKTNTLIISAPPQVMPVAEALVKELDHPRAAVDVVDVRIFALTNAQAQPVAEAVRRAVEAKARASGEPMEAIIAAEPSSNSIVVTATPGEVAHIETLVNSLDETPPVDQVQVRTVFLKHARAETVAPLIEELLGVEEMIEVRALPWWAQVNYYEAQSRLRQGGTAPPEVRVAADVRLNAVVISAPATVLGIAEQMVAQLDVDRSGLDAAGGRHVRVLVVENAEAQALAENLEAIFAEETDTDARPTIRVDAASNSLIVRATEAQFQTIEQVTSSIDRATLVTAKQMRMIPIDPSIASAQELARTLKRMLERRGADESAVEVITLEELLERREREIESEEDRAPPGPTSALPGNRAGLLFLVAAAALAQVDDQKKAPGTVSGADLTIAVDPATNSLVIVGSARAIERIAGLTEQLLSQIPAPPGRVRYIGLPAGADAWATAQLINQTLSQMTTAGGRRGDLRQRVAVLADRTNNALIVTCNDRDFETVGDLIAALSRAPTTEQLIVKVYPLETVTADRAAKSVREMLDPDPQAARGRQAQRMRDLAVTLLHGEEEIQAVFDPDRVKVTADAQTNAVVVMGPPAAIGFVDEFIELLDQTPVNVRATLKLYPLQHARARELDRTLRRVFQTRFYSMRNQLGPGSIVPEFSVDERTNTLLVTASPEQLAEVDALLDELDRKLGEDRYPLHMIELTAARPGDAATILDKVVLGDDQARRASTMIVPDETTGVLLVRAPEEVMTEIREVLVEIDRPPAAEFKVRTIVLERADASSVAGIMQRLYDDRARIASAGRGRRETARRVSVIGDRNSNTLLVAASDEDFEQIRELVKGFDTPEGAQALSFRVFQLKHAKATEIEDTVESLVDDLTWNQGPWFFWWGGGGRGNQRDRSQGTLAVRADARLNALIVTGEGDKFDVIEKLIDVLDAPQPLDEQRLVRLYRLEHADVDIVSQMILETYTDMSRGRRWWEPPDPTEVKVRTDARAKALIVSGSAKQLEEIAELIKAIDEQVAPGEQQLAVVPVEFAEAPELARTLGNFLRDRAAAIGAAPPSATVVASRSANTLIVSAEAEELATIRDLLARLDQPDLSRDRTIEIVVLQEGDADEIARIITQQFGRRGGAGVVVTPDQRTNSLIVNAPREQFAQARALIERLDAPPASDETIIRTYALEGARAEDVVRILTENLQLDASGETKGISVKLEDSDAPAVEVKARVVADRRSNSLIVTATEESFPVIETLIARLDEVPAASPVEYRIIPLEHAVALDVTITLERFVRNLADGGPQPRIDYNRLENQLIVAATADQFEQIAAIVDELDQPSEKARITDFVPLRFAEAEQIQEALSVFYGPFAIEADTPAKINTRIVADPASNSLVITADESEWASIRALLAKLDSEEYDASLQLRVIPLLYADARSVAQAINEAFEADVPRQGRRGAERQPRRAPAQPAGDGERRPPDVPSVLVEAEEWVRAAAEPQTNSIIVSASRQNIAKIEQIVAQLDVADFAKLPPPKLIAVRDGDPEELAERLRDLYEQSSGDRRGRTGLRIVGDPASNTIIVRAQDEEFEQIRALAEALQVVASSQGLSVHVIKLRAASALRVREAIEEAFEAKADAADQPFEIRADPTGNSLIIACSGALLPEIRATVDQLDRLSPAAGQGIFIIELEHVSPDAATQVIETIGLDKPARDDSVSRLVTEPITITPLVGRNAVVIVANPADRETIVGLLKAIDHEPELAEAQVLVVSLRNAQASAVAQILDRILAPADQQADTALARAVQEQVRRLAVHRESADVALRLDLTKPIRVIADPALNALVISSTPANAEALRELAMMFDRLPLTDSVTVQLFPLQNIAADRFAAIVRDLFSQGKQLGQVPGSDLAGVPEGMVGRALFEEIALSVDERTNTVVVAGREDAVALVEVLSQRIDTDVATGWIEPRVIELLYADATELAETLGAILVEPAADRSQATPLQRQVARLRLARLNENGGRVLEADLYAPMSRLVIRPEPKINALVLVGTPMNLEVVTELVHMLDVEEAAPGALVRIYPVEHASATRLAVTITRLFDQQVASGAIRSEDRVIVSADERTNALVVTTSPRSFGVLEPLLASLDSAVAPEFGAIRRIELANASAARVGQIIQEMMDDRLERLRRVEPETADLERATIVPDLRTNSLIVGAGPESFEIIKTIADDLDRFTLADHALVRILPVVRNNVERIAETVDALMLRRYAEMPAEIRESQKPLVLTDPRSNSLLVAASPEDCQAICDLVEKLEAQPMNPAIGLHVIQITGSRVELLAPRLQSLMQQRQQSLGGASTASDRVSIEPDTASNSLIVAASEENIQVVRDLISALSVADEQRDPDTGFEMIQLLSSRASDMEDLLQDLYVGEANRRRGRETVRVTADERLNALLVSAPEVDLAAIKRLASQLDGAKPSTVIEIKFVALTSANSLETVSLIENVLSGRGIGTRTTPRQATVMKYLREFAVGTKGDGIGGPFDEMEVSAAVRESIQLTPDLRTNTIIVSAPAPAISMIERMIRDLDATSTGAQNIRIFKLANADALAMAEILSDLFNLELQGNLYVLKPRELMAPGEELAPGVQPVGGVQGFGGIGLMGTELTAVPDVRQALSLTVDSRTNSLLVSGTPTYLDLVDQVVEELDALEANERDVLVYQLRNAVATEVADVVTRFVDQEQQKLLSTLSPDQLGSAARLLEREVTIVGDEKSNTVMVSASPRYMDRVEQMIGELDIDPPQVLVQVLIAEITLDTTDEWAVDFEGTLSSGSKEVTGQFGLGTLGSAFLNALGVPSLSVTTSDFDLLIRALNAQGRFQVLSNPSVMAANNQPATIQVGENIGRATSSRLSDGGTQQTDVEFIDIGVILEVTPSINPDGYVRMSITPEITELTNRTTQVTEDLEVPILTKRIATTTVTVRDGQTIVIGGLIEDQYEERVRKVPLLGDIPLIGKIFRSEFEQTSTTELLIVLTPHVVTSPAEAARMRALTEGEIDRLSLSAKQKRGLRRSRLDDEARTFRIEREIEGAEGADEPETDYAPGDD